MINTKKAIVSSLLVFVLVLSEICIVNTDKSFAAAKKIHLKKTTVSVAVGKSYQQKLIDKKGKTIKAIKVKWKSKKTSVAKISKKGKVTGIKEGTAKMTAKYKGKTYKFTVKVKVVPVSSISGPQSSVTLGVGDSKKIALTYTPSNATYKKCTWTSTDDSIVSVDENGVVTGKKMGWVDVTATSHNDKTATIRVRVEKLWFEDSEYTVGLGETKTIKLFGNVLLGLNINYYSSYLDLSIGQYDSTDGSFEVTITGKKAGKTTITAFDTYYNVDSVKATATINIRPTINTLVDYLKTNGQITVDDSGSSGSRRTTVALSSDGKSIVFSNIISTTSGSNTGITQSGLSIDIDFDNTSDEAYAYFRFAVILNGDSSNMLNYRMSSYVDGRTYEPGDMIDWEILEEDSSLSAQELGLLDEDGASAMFGKACGYWNDALNSALGMSLADIGMDKCD